VRDRDGKNKSSYRDGCLALTCQYLALARLSSLGVAEPVLVCYGVVTVGLAVWIFLAFPFTS